MGFYRLFHPELFQGRGKRRSYFEGWYFKMGAPLRSAIAGSEVSGNHPAVLAVIPGMAVSAEGEPSAFIQVIGGEGGKSWYVPFSFEQFHAAEKTLELTIGQNRFTPEGIAVDLEWKDLVVKGIVNFRNNRPYPVSLRSPGIMGWYAYVPFMECFHGVVSMRSDLEGSLSLNGVPIDFTGGRGYIEKDWGRSFPDAWIWIQANQFPMQDAACMLSIAKIPFLGRVFTGFLGFVLVEDRLIRFGTYTGADISELEVSGEHARIVIRQKTTIIRIHAHLGPGSHLAAPRQGSMDRTITETVNGSVDLHIEEVNGKTLYQGTGFHAGVELSEAHALEVNG